MANEIVPGMPSRTPALAPVLLQAEPEPLQIDRARTAVVVIDMQNAFASKGGIVDVTGKADVTTSQKIIPNIKKLNSAARARGCKVIYVAERWPRDLSNTGGPDSPNWYHSMLTNYREHPEWRDKTLVRGTWGAAIVDELKPQEGDIEVEKAKPSAFFETNLDTILKTYNIKYLVFTGTATNMCVEASLRDAYYRGYFAILASDATSNAGPPFTQDATIFNVKLVLGWVTTTENILKAMQ